jgi:hypothetical protein
MSMNLREAILNILSRIYLGEKLFLWGSGVDECSASSSDHFLPPEKNLHNLWIESWVGPRSLLDDLEESKLLKLLRLEVQLLGFRDHSQPLHYLSYPDSLTKGNPRK